MIAAAPNKKWIAIDEIQKNPRLLDVVHSLSKDKSLKFALTGSSARKLKRGAANLLAGRAFQYFFYPLLVRELGDSFYRMIRSSRSLTRSGFYLGKKACRRSVFKVGIGTTSAARSASNPLNNRILQISLFQKLCAIRRCVFHCLE